MIRKFRKDPRRMYESAEFELSLEDIGDLAQEFYMKSDELHLGERNGYNSYMEMLTVPMERKLKQLGFDVHDFPDYSYIVLNDVSEDDWNDAVPNLIKAENDWYEDEDTGLFLRYERGYLEIGCDRAFEAIDIDIYSNWETIASYMEKRIAKDDLDDYAYEDGNPAFWCIFERHFDEFEEAVLDYAELDSRFINKLKQIRNKF